MNAAYIDNLFRSLSWTFIHSLWMGLILTMLAGIVMFCTKTVLASIRYGLLSMLFFIFIGAVGITFIIEWRGAISTSPGTTLLEKLADSELLFNQGFFNQFYISMVTFLNSNAQWIVSAWLIVLCIKSAKIIMDIFQVSKLRTSSLHNPSAEWQERFQKLRDQLGIRKTIAFVESAIVKVPAVVGYVKPVVLIPAGILTQLPPGEIESILLHELAHIRRHDYLVNFIQRLAELIFFFNPGLLWVSGLIRIERENCCDDLVIATTGNKVQYLNAIISFKEYRLKQSGYVLGLFGKQHLLIQRMTRLVYQKNRILSPVELGFFISNIFILVLLLLMVKKPEILIPVVSKNINHTVDAFNRVINPGIADANPTPNPDNYKVYSDLLNDLDNAPLSDEIPAIGEYDVLGKIITEKLNGFDDQLTKDRFVGMEAEGKRLLGEMIKQSGNDLIQSEILRQTERGWLLAESDRQGADDDRIGGNNDQKQVGSDRQKAGSDRLQAEKDRLQADIDRLQAEKDRQQAYSDRHKAQSDLQQAQSDRQQAEIDRQRAENDRQQAENDRQRADSDRQLAIEYRLLADKDREQALMDKGIADRDSEKAKLDRMNAEKKNLSFSEQK